MFWERYVSLCNQIGKSANAVAAECGLTSGSVTGWSRGAKPRASAVKKIADYFDVPIEYLTEKEKPASVGSDADAALIFGLYGDVTIDIDPEELEDVRRYAAFLREKKGKK